jgi:cytidylate kinase
MFRIITVEREYGCGAAEIARQLASSLGWKLWDRELTDEIARVAQVDSAAVCRCDERCDGRLHRLVKVFWRGSYERSTKLDLEESLDADRVVEIGEQVMREIAEKGNCVIVGRGAPYHLRGRSDTFHVFMYAPRAEKLRRIQKQGKSLREAEELVDTIDRDRIEFIKHYFGADWPTRSLYHVMLNTVVGDENVISTIQYEMRTLEGTPIYAGR